MIDKNQENDAQSSARERLQADEVQSLADLEKMSTTRFADSRVRSLLRPLGVISARAVVRQPIRLSERFKRYEDGGDGADGVQYRRMRKARTCRREEKRLMKLDRVDHVRHDETAREEGRDERADDSRHR